MKNELVLQAKKGNKQAIEKLLKENYAQFYKTAYLYSKNETDALDIVQEAMIKIFQKIATINQPEYFTTWGIRIVIFTALDHLKTKKKNDAVVLEENILDPEVVLSKEENLDIYAAIACLPKHLQEVTILHYFCGKKLHEISAVFGEPLGTTKYKLHEARKKLKNYLEEEDK